MIAFTVSVSEGEQQDILLAQLYDEYDLEGAEQQTSSLVIYASPKSAPKIQHFLQSLNIEFTKKEYESQNWNAVWESNFEPVVVDDFCAVRANFHAPMNNVQYEIEITPKMSFGTGHHATTYQMLQQMRKIQFAGKRVVDYGTGTGVLAILAEKLGAAYIEAIDNDDWSIENTIENIAVNKCRAIKVIKADAIQGNDFDIILANINKNVLLNSMEHIMKSAKNNGILLFSGILVTDKADMQKAISAFKPADILFFEKNGWLAIVVNK